MKILKKTRIPIYTLICCFALNSTILADSPWIDKKAKPTIWKQVESLFREELKPDDENMVAPYAAYQYKYIKQMSNVGEVYLVIIGKRLQKSNLPADDSVLAFSLNLSTGRKHRIDSWGGYRWKPVKWAFLTQGVHRELVSQYQDCLDCEAYNYLSVFYFDSATGAWNIRLWPDDGPGLMIGADVQIGTRDNWETLCLHTIKDVTGDGMDDILVWCRQLWIESSQIKQESVSIYTVSDGITRKIAPTASQANILKRDLCNYSNANASMLCK
jgi:hypothetical protein